MKYFQIVAYGRYNWTSDRRCTHYFRRQAVDAEEAKKALPDDFESVGGEVITEISQEEFEQWD